MAVSSDVWCGGGLGKQRTAQPQRRKQRARRELFLLQNRSAPAICVAVVEVRREGREEAEEWRELAEEAVSVVSLASVKHWFYASFRPNVFSS